MRPISVIAICAAMLLALPVVGGPYDDGLAAYHAGKYSDAMDLWFPLANKGDARAQVWIAKMNRMGRGVTRNFDEALKWYRKAADQGNPEARHAIGEMYAAGLGVKQDYKEALRWYQAAAEQKFAPAQYSVGTSYFKGQGVSTDYVAAYAWMVVAVRNGYDKGKDFRDLVASTLDDAERRRADAMATKLLGKYSK
ncbi:MAG: sel1 repeat family protein [Pseudomonadota bacterium]|nr:MAG: sel1 repeat family protein [Pseudomonadota bacterium]